MYLFYLHSLLNCGGIDLTSFLYRLFTLEKCEPRSFLTLAQNLLYCTLSWVVRFQDSHCTFVNWVIYCIFIRLIILQIQHANHFVLITLVHLLEMLPCSFLRLSVFWNKNKLQPTVEWSVVSQKIIFIFYPQLYFQEYSISLVQYYLKNRHENNMWMWFAWLFPHLFQHLCHLCQWSWFKRLIVLYWSIKLC